jgi:hypothetical protein
MDDDSVITMASSLASAFFDIGGPVTVRLGIENDYKAGIIVGSLAAVTGIMLTGYTVYRAKEYHSDFFRDLKQNTEVFLYRMSNTVRLP